MADRFTDADAGYDADMDCTTTPSRTLLSLEVMEDPLGLRLAKRRTLRRGITRKTKPRSLEIRQGRLQPQPPPPPELEAPEIEAPEQEVPSVALPPPVTASPEASLPVATPPAATSAPAISPPVEVEVPEEESDSDSSSDGEDSPSPTTSSFPDDVASATGLPAGSQTTISPSATDGLTSRPVVQDGTFDPSRQAQGPTLGIVFGSVGAAFIVLCAACSIWFLWMYRRKKRMSKLVPPSNPPVTDSYMANAYIPPDRGAPRRSPSSLMDELMSAAYDVERGGQPEQETQAPHGYLNEKRYDPSQQLPILQPVPVVQPTLRWSIASWVRRHNPLKLNPVDGRNSMYSTTSAAVPADPSAPPVPAVPALFQSRGNSAEDDRALLVPPPLAVQRVTSSHYSEPGDNGQSPVSAYARNSGTWFQRNLMGSAKPQQQQQSHPFNARAVSMAPTEQTTSNISESTWTSWGAGVTRPQQHHQQQQQQQPHTPRRAWIEKCVKLGGWK